MYSTYALAAAMIAGSASAMLDFNLVTAYASSGLDTLNSDTKNFFFFTQLDKNDFSTINLSLYDLEAMKTYSFELVEGVESCDMKSKVGDIDLGETIMENLGGDVQLRSKVMMGLDGEFGMIGKYLRMSNDDGVISCSEVKLSGDDFGTDIFGASGFPGPNKIDERSSGRDRDGGEKEEAIVNEKEDGTSSKTNGGWSLGN